MRVIDYVREENRVLREQLGGRLADDQRRRLAVKAKALGRKVLDQIATIVTVVPLNWDLADTVGVEHFPSVLSCGRVIGIAGRNAVAFPDSSGIAA